MNKFKYDIMVLCGSLAILLLATPLYAKTTMQEASALTSWYQPEPLTTWQWQLQGEVNTSYNVEVYNIDLFDSSKALIESLQDNNKKVICYFSGGSYENWRPDEDQFKKDDLGKTLDGWPGERWLDIRSNNVRNIMKGRLDLAQQKGCDGVEPDNMDGYTNKPGFSFTPEDQINYNKFIAKEAHARNLSVGLKNDLDQINDLVDHFDFAVNEQCFQYNECDVLKPFITQGKAVFNAEYKSSYVRDPTSVCKKSKKLKFSTLILPLNLNDSLRHNCLEDTGVVDTIPPVIKINGSKKILLVPGRTYEDKGATATDNVDTTVEVKSSGVEVVDTSVPGAKYYITYTAKDSAGNEATPVVRTVTIAILTDIVLMPKIFINGESSLTINQHSTYTDAGATAVDKDGNQLTVETEGDVDTAVLGAYSITYKAVDDAGNSSTKNRTVDVVENNSDMTNDSSGGAFGFLLLPFAMLGLRRRSLKRK